MGMREDDLKAMIEAGDEPGIGARRAVEHRRLRAEVKQLQERVGNMASGSFVAGSAPMRRVLEASAWAKRSNTYACISRSKLPPQPPCRHCKAITSFRNDGFTGFSPCLGLLFQYLTMRTSPFHSLP